MEQKIYLVITRCRGYDDEFTKIVGAYSTKDKALSKLWQKLETTIKLMEKNSEYKLDKNEDFYTLQNEDDGSITETYIKEMGIE